MCCPKAKIVMHETWAYEEGSEKLANLGFNNQKEMYDALHSAYCNATYASDAALKIPSGTLFQKLYDKGFKFHRDTFHAQIPQGRYLLCRPCRRVRPYIFSLREWRRRGLLSLRAPLSFYTRATGGARRGGFYRSYKVRRRCDPPPSQARRCRRRIYIRSMRRRTCGSILARTRV